MTKASGRPVGRPPGARGRGKHHKLQGGRHDKTAYQGNHATERARELVENSDVDTNISEWGYFYQDLGSVIVIYRGLSTPIRKQAPTPWPQYGKSTDSSAG